MDNLIDIMYKKRFNLQTTDVSKCMCHENTTFYHMACCFEKEGGKILSFGQNYFPLYSENYKSPTCSVHAERDAINKLPKIRRKKKINMLVLRFTKSKQLTMSMPCKKCVDNMHRLFPKKGYIVQNIYYSNHDGSIQKTNLSKIINRN